MMRRVGFNASRTAAPATTTTRRLYTDYARFKYPTLWNIALGCNLFWITLALMLVRANSYMTTKGQVIGQGPMKAFKRTSGEGYKWGDELPDTLDSMYVNVPDEADLE